MAGDKHEYNFTTGVFYCIQVMSNKEHQFIFYFILSVIFFLFTVVRLRVGLLHFVQDKVIKI